METPNENFIKDYLEFAYGDEAPQNYHIWAGLSTLASIVSRRVWLKWGRFTVYPNLYIVLLGPPGNGKTTALSYSKGITRELKFIPFSAECQTKESLVREMKGYERAFQINGEPILYTPISVLVTELSHFLGPNSGHMVDFLTTIYDQDFYDTKTKNKGDDIIIGPFVNMLACTTPQWVTTYLRSDIISGGFTRRAIFINEDEGADRIPFPAWTDAQLAARKRVLNQANRLAKVAGEIAWDPEAHEWFASWYKSYELPTDLSVRWYHKTKHFQFMKVASLIAVADSHDQLVLRPQHLELALALLDKIEVNLVKVFQGMGRNELNSISNKLLDILTLAGGTLPEKQVLSAMGRDANMNEMYQIIDFLRRTDKILEYNKDGEQMIGVKEFVLRNIPLRPPRSQPKPPATSPTVDATDVPPSSVPAVLTKLDSSPSGGQQTVPPSTH